MRGNALTSIDLSIYFAKIISESFHKKKDKG